MVSTNQHVRKTFLFVGCIAVTGLLLQFNMRSAARFLYEEQKILNVTCEEFLLSLSSLNIVGIVVDLNYLKTCQENGTYVFNQLKVAILNDTSLEKSVLNKDGVYIEVISYFDDTSKDFWTFEDNGTIKAIPRMPLTNISTLEVPENSQLFMEYWSRSRILECMDIEMNRTDTSYYLPIPKSFELMARLRDRLVSHGMFPFLMGGTLLGWYRECNIIPHTHDIDFGVFVEQFNSKFEAEILSKKTEFRLKSRLGLLNDSFEYAVIPKNSKHPKIDIFFMYKEKELLWVGGTDGQGQKYRYYYPSFDPSCSADLGGHLFWVACIPETVLKADYGEWQLDHPTSKYTWNKSGKNLKAVGRWPKHMLKRVMYNI